MSSENLVRKHVQGLLMRDVSYHRVLMERVQEIESEGGRIVDGGPGDLLDWRTDQVIVRGAYDLDEEESEALWQRLDPEDKWVHIDQVLAEEDLVEVVTPGLPVSLAIELETWVALATTTPKELALATGWPIGVVEDIRGHSIG